MTFYTAVILMTELLMLAMTLHVLHYSGFTKVQKTWFLLTFGAVMLCAGAEFTVHGVAYRPVYKTPLTIVTVVQFSLAPLLGILFSGALGLHRQKRVAVGFLALNVLVEAAAAPFGLVFYFDAAGYHRGGLFLIYEAFYFLSLVYLIVNMFVVGKRFSHRDARTIAMILLMLIAGIVPMTVFKLNITYLAIAISACLCYIYYNDLVQQDIQAELVENQKLISEMQGHIISGMASLIENRDTDTGGHISRTGAYVRTLAEYARAEGVYADRLTDHFILLLQTLAPMHDVGKIVIPDSILKKPGRLTAEEFEQMKRHAAVGGDVVREVLSGITDEEYLSFAADIAACHHERWDGTGYPNGLAGEQIPLAARIMAIADVYDALVSERCYKQPIPPEEAFVVMEQESGTHFDPQLIAVFLRHKEAFASLSGAAR
ncbi:MAG: HD domain-containing protein [Oscillospiraceae bacterium]|nr:HD domain-containing protein [Oscillospiraceae bacterium]